MAHTVAERPPQRDGQEEQDHVAGKPGAAEHPGALARALRRLGGLRLGQLDLLPYEGGEVAGDLTDQITEGPGVLGRDPRWRAHLASPSPSALLPVQSATSPVP